MKSSLVLSLLTLILAPAAQAKPPSDVQDFVFMGPHRPILVRLHFKIDGKPYEQAWNEFFEYLFTYLDKDKDGKLSETEQKSLNSLGSLFNLGAIPSPFGNVRVVQPANTPSLPEPAGIKELRQFFENLGAAPMRLGGTSPNFGFRGQILIEGYGGGQQVTGASLNKALLTLLDDNKDGKLSRKELSAAEGRLLKRDFNEDEILSTDEALGNKPVSATNQLAIVDGPIARVEQPKAGRIVLVEAGKPSHVLAKKLEAFYGKSKLGSDNAVTNQLDTDKNGQLDLKELAQFSTRKPDVEIDVELGKKPGVGVTNRSNPKNRESRKVVKVDLTELELTVAGGTGGEGAVVQFAGQGYDAQFKRADADGNGYLDQQEAVRNSVFGSNFQLIDADEDKKVYLKEVKAFYAKFKDLQTRAKNSWGSLSVNDSDRGLFGLIDRDGDDRLSVREMRHAVDLLKTFDRDKDGAVAVYETPRRFQIRFNQGSAGYDPFASTRFIRLGGRYVRPRSTPAPAKGPDWFRKMDRNRDGDVSEREFLGKKEIFQKMDKDGDRLVSVQEAERFDNRSRDKKE